MTRAHPFFARTWDPAHQQAPFTGKTEGGARIVDNRFAYAPYKKRDPRVPLFLRFGGINGKLHNFPP